MEINNFTVKEIVYGFDGFQNLGGYALLMYGYSHDRDSLEVYLDEYELVRHRGSYYNGQEYSWEEEMRTDIWTMDIFLQDVKRWYADSVNETVVRLCQTFGTPLPLVARNGI